MVVLYAIFALLCVSIILNIVQFLKIRDLNNRIRELRERFDMTGEELIQIRKRIERLKGEI